MTNQQQQEVLCRCENELVAVIARSIGVSYPKVFSFIKKQGIKPLTRKPKIIEQIGKYFDVDVYLKQTQTI